MPTFSPPLRQFGEIEAISAARFGSCEIVPAAIIWSFHVQAVAASAASGAKAARPFEPRSALIFDTNAASSAGDAAPAAAVPTTRSPAVSITAKAAEMRPRAI